MLALLIKYKKMHVITLFFQSATPSEASFETAAKAKRVRRSTRKPTPKVNGFIF